MAFSNSSSLESMSLGDSLSSIEFGCFSGSTGFTSNYEVPSSVKTIGKYAFRDTNFVVVVIPEGIQEIGYNAFLGCDKLENLLFKGSILTADYPWGIKDPDDKIKQYNTVNKTVTTSKSDIETQLQVNRVLSFSSLPDDMSDIKKVTVGMNV